jgi:hypothetical protein
MLVAEILLFTTADPIVAQERSPLHRIAFVRPARITLAAK